MTEEATDEVSSSLFEYVALNECVGCWINCFNRDGCWTIFWHNQIPQPWSQSNSNRQSKFDTWSPLSLRFRIYRFGFNLDVSCYLSNMIHNLWTIFRTQPRATIEPETPQTVTGRCPVRFIFFWNPSIYYSINMFSTRRGSRGVSAESVQVKGTGSGRGNRNLSTGRVSLSSSTAALKAKLDQKRRERIALK